MDQPFTALIQGYFVKGFYPKYHASCCTALDFSLFEAAEKQTEKENEGNVQGSRGKGDLGLGQMVPCNDQAGKPKEEIAPFLQIPDHDSSRKGCSMQQVSDKKDKDDLKAGIFIFRDILIGNFCDPSGV